MAEEIFDVVNERDEPIGRAPRREVHARKLWHRAVHILVFNTQGQVFLQKRSMKKDSSPGLWDSSCSGHVDAGEDYDTAAVRELGEEIGWMPDVHPKRLLKLNACGETGNEFVWVYFCFGEGPFRLNPDEIELGCWLKPDEIDLMINANVGQFAEAFVYIWPKANATLREKWRQNISSI